MTLSQIEDSIRGLAHKEQLQLLSWLAQYIRNSLFSLESLYPNSNAEYKIDEIDHPLEGTLLKYEDPFEPVALADWDALQ